MLLQEEQLPGFTERIFQLIKRLWVYHINTETAVMNRRFSMTACNLPLFIFTDLRYNKTSMINYIERVV